MQQATPASTEFNNLLPLKLRKEIALERAIKFTSKTETSSVELVLRAPGSYLNLREKNVIQMSEKVFRGFEASICQMR